MPLFTALLALSAIGQTQAQITQTVKLAGHDVSLTFPATADDSVPDEYTNWPGWTYLSGTPSGVSRRPYRAYPTDAVKTFLAQQQAGHALPWHIKVVIFRKVDVLTHEADGSVTQQRSSLESSQIEALLEAVLRFKVLVQEESGGGLDPILDVSVEDQAMRIEAWDSGDGYKREDFIENYLRARVNGGGYEPDDKVYRGPYQAVLCIDPSLPAEPALQRAQDAGARAAAGVTIDPRTPPDRVPFTRIPVLADHTLNHAPDQAIELTLYRGFWEQFRDLAIACGVSGDRHELGASGLPTLDSIAPADTWLTLAGTPAADISGAPLPEDDGHGATLQSRTSNVSLSFVTDPDRGQVLRYQENGFYRNGFVGAPVGAGGLIGDVRTNHYLSFWAKSKSRSPLEIELQGFGAIELGNADPDLKRAERRAALVDFKPDGTWQHVVVDLSAIPDRKGDSATGLFIGPSEAARGQERTDLAAIDYSFDQFKFESTLGADETLSPLIASNPGFDSPNERDRVGALLSIGTDATPEQKSKVIALLGDYSDTVRLNAIEVEDRLKDPSAEPALTKAANYMGARISQAALKALADLGTESAWASIRAAMFSGANDLARATAATLLATKHEPSLAGPISALMANRSWAVRKAAAEAVASLPGKESAIVLMDFLQDVDPEVRLAATASANAAQDTVASRLLYSAVNDPSDEVRAWSNIKLIESGNEKLAAEGYKGVRDDGWECRLILLDYLRLHPIDGDTHALRLALTDDNPQVRTLALEALAASPGKATLDELSPVLHDQNPWVQRALLKFAKTVELPKETLDMMKLSKDPRVVATAKEVGG